MRLRLLLVALALTACGNEPPEVDDLARCMQVQDEWRALVGSIDHSCVDARDCATTGTPASNCDETLPTVGGCDGDPVNGAALTGRQDEIDALLARWSGCSRDAYCDDLGCSADCEEGRAECHQGTCVAVSACRGPCDPVTQLGCYPEGKCTWIHVDEPNDVGYRCCVDDGDVAVGDTCAFGADGPATGFDDCVAGAICVDGVCAPICTTTDDTCAAPTICTVQPRLFYDGVTGACVP